MNVFRILTLAAVTAAAGCVGLVQLGGHGGDPAQGGAYAGDECAILKSNKVTVFESDDENGRSHYSGDLTPGMTPLEAAAFVACVDKTGGNGPDSTSAIVADHLDFDDRHFDQVRASTMVIDCAMNEDCSPRISRDIVGMMAGYAKRIDPAAADRALAADGASAGLRSAFGAKLAWARQVIAQRVSELDPRRKQLWVDIPEQVWSERQAYYTRFAALYAQLDPALAAAAGDGPAADAAAAKIRALRGRYLAQCKVEGCLFTPFVLETTRALVLNAVREHDVVRALAENALLRDDRLVSQLFSRAMLQALLPACAREAAQWEKYNRAQGDGADPTALQAMFGPVAPIHISSDSPWITWGQRRLPDLTAALSTDGITNVSGNVRAVQRQGDRARVLFADIVTTVTDEDCHETDKVDGIASDGTLIYREDCRTVSEHAEHTKIPPIEVPAAEAASLRSGELVTAVVTAADRRGEIVNVQQRGKLVQVRGVRLRVPEQVRAQD